MTLLARDDPWALYASQNLGHLALLDGDTEAARAYVHPTLDRAHKSGDNDIRAGAFSVLATAAVMDDDIDSAARFAAANLEHERELGFSTDFARKTLRIIAALAERLDDPVSSAQLLGAAEAILDRSRSARGLLYEQLHQETLQRLRARISAATIAAEVAAGKQLNEPAAYTVAANVVERMISAV